MCSTRLDFKIENATLEDVVSQVKKLLANQSVPIEVRGATPVRVGFTMKDTPAGDVLGSVAALAGCKVFLMADGLLIAPPPQLTAGELQQITDMQGGEWARDTASGGDGWSNMNMARGLFVKAIAQEVTGSDILPFPVVAVKTTFGTFSPESQKLIQQLVDWATERVRARAPGIPPLVLSANSPISVDTSDPHHIHIGYGGGQSDPNPGGGSMSIYVQ